LGWNPLGATVESHQKSGSKAKSMRYQSQKHSAKYTGDYVFSQLIPYIGNKRKLLPLIGQAIARTGLKPENSTFLDCFSGSGVVSRYAKQLGFAVIANDWEPYAEVISLCYTVLNHAPTFDGSLSYTEIIDQLNHCKPEAGWITDHLCPADDVEYDIKHDRMFYMRKNGMRLDAIREQIEKWDREGKLNKLQKSALLGPLIYQACWLSNTSGVFKGFHNGWGGQTATALYRICADLFLEPALFLDNKRSNQAFRMNASDLVVSLENDVDFAYLDPPYNQHPYGSNYHVLNTLVLWDRPDLPSKITHHGNKSAIRRDWRTERRSAYNDKTKAASEYSRILGALRSKWICTSYSTDGFIPLEQMMAVNCKHGEVSVFVQEYKRYRVSSQRFSEKPMNVEFVVLIDTSKQSTRSPESYTNQILKAEATAIASHIETPTSDQPQMEIFNGQ